MVLRDDLQCGQNQSETASKRKRRKAPGVRKNETAAQIFYGPINRDAIIGAELVVLRGHHPHED